MEALETGCTYLLVVLSLEAEDGNGVNLDLEMELNNSELRRTCLILSGLRDFRILLPTFIILKMMESESKSMRNPDKAPTLILLLLVVICTKTLV